jgi:hypothetical protein
VGEGVRLMLGLEASLVMEVEGWAGVPGTAGQDAAGDMCQPLEGLPREIPAMKPGWSGWSQEWAGVRATRATSVSGRPPYLHKSKECA